MFDSYLSPYQLQKFKEMYKGNGVKAPWYYKEKQRDMRNKRKKR